MRMEHEFPAKCNWMETATKSERKMQCKQIVFFFFLFRLRSVLLSLMQWSSMNTFTSDVKFWLLMADWHVAVACSTNWNIKQFRTEQLHSLWAPRYDMSTHTHTQFHGFNVGIDIRLPLNMCVCLVPVRCQFAMKWLKNACKCLNSACEIEFFIRFSELWNQLENSSFALHIFCHRNEALLELASSIAKNKSTNVIGPTDDEMSVAAIVCGCVCVFYCEKVVSVLRTEAKKKKQQQ